MTLDVYRGRKTTMQQQQLNPKGPLIHLNSTVYTTQEVAVMGKNSKSMTTRVVILDLVQHSYDNENILSSQDSAHEQPDGGLLHCCFTSMVNI